MRGAPHGAPSHNPLAALPRELRDALRAGLDLLDSDVVNSAGFYTWEVAKELGVKCEMALRAKYFSNCGFKNMSEFTYHLNSLNVPGSLGC